MATNRRFVAKNGLDNNNQSITKTDGIELLDGANDTYLTLKCANDSLGSANKNFQISLENNSNSTVTLYVEGASTTLSGTNTGDQNLAIPVATSSATGNLTIDVGTVGFAERTGLTATTTIATTGTPTNGQKLMIRLKDNGTSRSLTWNAIFVQGGPSLPTATTAGKWMHLGFVYNSTNSKWMLVASSVEA